MLCYQDSSFDLQIQDFFCYGIEDDPENEPKGTTIMYFKSDPDAHRFMCEHCNRKMHVCEQRRQMLRDMPLYLGDRLKLEISTYRYRCPDCGSSRTEEIGFQEPGTRITARAAYCIRKMLACQLSVSVISRLTGIHWETIRKIHQETVEEKLAAYEEELMQRNYRPKLLAVDEFSIRKGHRYATCVLDLQTGYILWIGEGRGKEDFRKFFREYDIEKLSEAEAFAMDMNASYDSLVQEYLPKAQIVYDRFHMQAQYGRDVLGTERLKEAREHKKEADALKEQYKNQNSSLTEEKIKQIKEEEKEERTKYRTLKKSRWPILRNKQNLPPEQAAALDAILKEHEVLSTCYTMKEEMIRLFELRDPDEARKGWERWFRAAEQSGIESLQKFASNKKKRIEGLINHALYPISTAKLEGINNKTKVAKRIAYGYRNLDYFFSLLRFLSIPSIRPVLKSPQIP